MWYAMWCVVCVHVVGRSGDVMCVVDNVCVVWGVGCVHRGCSVGGSVGCIQGCVGGMVWCGGVHRGCSMGGGVGHVWVCGGM